MRLKNMSLPAFAEYIKGKEIVCLGAGKLFDKACKTLPLERYVKALIDNAPSKQGKQLEFAGKKFKILPWSELRQNIQFTEKTIVLVSAGMARGGKELYEKLIKEDIPAETECFFLSFIFAELESVEKIGRLVDFRLSEKPLIPKYIHYCWFGKKKIPEEQEKFIEGWHEKCPDFEIIRWDESNYDVKKNKYMRKAYEEERWGFVPDFARKDIIYRYGGIYLDTDVEIVRNLDELLYQKGFAGVQWDNRVALGLGFGGIPGLDIMAEMCEAYEKSEFSFREGFGMKVGPDYETKIMKLHGYDKEKGWQTVAEMTIYPVEVLSGTLPYSNKSLITENTFAVHHYAGSWIVGQRKMMIQGATDFYSIVAKESEN